ncbi:cytochrome C [Variovorax paradoxus]|uniref:c-type cytochrome n=1 Tax=Variovorax TaxID=34072 RepID=UPI0006E5E952|nr:c-type cytochrome [Variovorax boronicumulans]KPU89550.1 cytochrome C [Variovorax paradoxus]KPU99335.1 cytochrome C [Variovorax paradoxus]KPV01018.1 cytochrome C [Variovorax paradoxus]KPV16679.1 cytochrome C [Variovorax paradoxus]KPV26493.1 cytochrome C [Variovorax paradoxus]
MKLLLPLLLAALGGLASGTSFAADPMPMGATEKATSRPAKADIANGEVVFNAKSCAACHSADGNSSVPANPKLAQQHPEYLLKQLQEFKSGKRKSAVMAGMAAMLSDQEMRDVAWFLGSKPIKPGFAREKDLVALGEKIYRGGIGDRAVPACAGCHSPNGAGIPIQYPRLGGQHAEYVAAQLTAFRDGTRLNSTPMNGVAARLNDREIKAVSDYIAGLH